ncbi:MAG: tyrosine-type recombinase/integrase [Nautiliaceae bacterium]
MAIKHSEFKDIGIKNIKQHKKDKLKFLLDFTYQGKRYKKVVTLSHRPNWTLKEYKKEAQRLLSEFQMNIKAGYKQNEDMKIDELFELFMQNNPTSESWDKKRKEIYRRYIKAEIGSKRLKDIKPLHIGKIISKMRDKDLSPNTQNKVLVILRPMFEFAIHNKLIKENPAKDIHIKQKDTKKIVINAQEKLKRIYQGIMELYADDPYYRAFFLFALSGRRKSEILQLRWENIDLENNYYWIADAKPNENQRYDLPPLIKEALLELGVKRKGWVFFSFKNPQEHLKKPDRQVDRPKKYLDIPEFSLHYCHHILASALIEKGIPTSIVSGVLGHKNATTINKYVSINYHTSTQKANQEMLEIIEPK